ncbi:MAG: hypothetical protein ACFCVE_07215, partial [Phycisphaerae bacterium]
MVAPRHPHPGPADGTKPIPAGPGRLWVQHDANFNVTSLTNNAGAVVKRFTYDPYGRHAARRSLGEVRAANWSLST